MRRLLFPLLLLIALVPAAPASAIVGGGPATEEYPWMVSLREKGGHICGASVVHPEWILTAAHCVDGGKAEDFSGVIGRHTLSGAGGDEIPADRIVVHEAYATDQAGGHDIALLHLERPTAAAPVRIVSVGEAGLWAAGKPARVIGWGSSVFLVGPASEDLQQVDVPMVHDDDCGRNYNQLSPFEFDPSTMVCAGEETGMKDSCQGDSGGPLVVKDGAGAWTQVGTVSFGLGCGFPFYYGVYGRIGGPVLNAWLAKHLPASGTAPAPAAGGGSGGSASPSPGASGGGSAKPGPVRLSFGRSLGSAKRAKRARKLRLRVHSTGRVTRLKATVTRAGRKIAAGKLSMVNGTATLVLPVRPSVVRPGALGIRLVAVDASGRTVRRSGSARLAR
jgi:secreted trypsin-like serine protease